MSTDSPSSGADGTQLGRRRVEPADDHPPSEELAHRAESTQLGRRRAGAAPPGAAATAQGREKLPANGPGTDRAPEGDEVLRFGPGVAAGPQVPSWTSPAAAATARRRPGRWVGALLTLAIIVGVVLFLFLRGGDEPAVRSTGVRTEPAQASCGATVDVVGTITTDGSPGTVRYQWLRSDGQTSEVLAQSVASGVTTTEVHLQWSVTGNGRLDAQATLRVLEPTPSEAVGGFTYSCP